MIGTAGQWEVFLSTEVPEQQEYKFSSYVSGIWIPLQVLCLGWRTTLGGEGNLGSCRLLGY